MPKKDVTELRQTRKEQQRRADDRFTWRVLGVMLFLGVWTFLLYRFSWPPYLYALPSGAAVLYLLSYIYPRDFTALAVFVSGGALGLWFLTVLYQRSGRWDLLAHILFAAAIAGSALLVWLLKRKGGALSLGKKTLTVIPRKGQYLFLFIACGLLAAALTAAIIFGSSAALYAMIAMFCYLFIAAVYYTVRLI
ncbi:MAG: hypothetical protein LBI19_06570 [Oscillospiraceae bacterium]|jgi:hypothetical protein|nr:hypothetical protein [Oscillospiraceae bacterium]